MSLFCFFVVLVLGVFVVCVVVDMVDYVKGKGDEV